jgi:hypothetical protein
MVNISPGGDPGRSTPGWQHRGIDVEIERINWRGSLRFRWALYHQNRLIRTGMCRWHRAALMAGAFAEWWYRLWTD